MRGDEGKERGIIEVFSLLAGGEGLDSILSAVAKRLDAEMAVAVWAFEDSCLYSLNKGSFSILEDLKFRLIDHLRHDLSMEGSFPPDADLDLLEEDFDLLDPTAGEPAWTLVEPINLGGEIIGGVAFAGYSSSPPESASLREYLALLALSKRIEEAEAEREANIARFSHIVDVGEVFAKIGDFDRALSRLLDLCLTISGGEAGAIVLAEGSGIEVGMSWGFAPEWVGLIRSSDGAGIIGRVIESGEPAIFQNLDLPGGPDLSEIPAVFSSLGILPLESEGKVLGAVVIANAPSVTYSNPVHLRSVSTIAALSAAAITNARLIEERIKAQKYEEELRIAYEIQQGLLPKTLPEFPCIEIATRSDPARNVGGDYYDFLPLGSDKIGVVVADVSGKGVGAAMLMATGRAYLKAISTDGRPLSEISSALNNVLCGELDDNRFITGNILLIDLASMTAEMANAGHHPILKVSSGGELERLDAEGIPWGIVPGEDYPTTNSRLCEGDLIIMYTDGVVEAMGPGKTLYGGDRLAERAVAAAGRSAGEAMEAIHSDVMGHTRGLPPGDDLTMVILRILGTDART